ncbi:H/ACA RNA-protein complex component Gar1 [Halobellus sp. Atlit-31R]|nr:H/ACA RNA-protein complex component Gar1 [Halobellus sp. Atlit-31R]
MQRLGTVSRTAQNLLVVRCDDADHPAIGAEAVDESLTTVGRVVDVFGPVSRPYVAVSPSGDVPAASVVGTRLYAR